MIGFLSFLFETTVDGFMYRDGFLGFFMSTIMTIVVLFVLLLAGWGVIWLADNVGMTPVRAQGTIVSSEFVPAHTTTTYTTINNVTTPIITHYPDAWYVTIQVGELTDSVPVTQNYYTLAEKGMPVNVMYVSGRVTGGLYIKEILRWGG